MEVKKIVEGMTAVEVAEVIDSNFKNQNKILEEDIAKQNNVIGVSEYKDFSEAEAVSVGDVRKYEGFLYECVEATTGSFDASKWKKSSFKAETEKKLSELGSEVGKLSVELFVNGYSYVNNTQKSGYNEFQLRLEANNTYIVERNSSAVAEFFIIAEDGTKESLGVQLEYKFTTSKNYKAIAFYINGVGLDFRIAKETSIEGELLNLNEVALDYKENKLAKFNPYTKVEFTTTQGFISTSLVIDTSNPNFSISSPFFVEGGNILVRRLRGYGNAVATLVECDSEGNLIKSLGISNGLVTSETYVEVGTWFRICFNNAYPCSVLYYQKHTNKNIYSGKTWVLFGDSLTEKNYRADMSYYDYIKNELGVNFVNYGVSGSGYKKSAYFALKIQQMDVDSFDFATIFGSFNDVNPSSGFVLGSATDTTMDTLGGAMNFALDKFFEKNPSKKIGLITPTPWKEYYKGSLVDSSLMENYVNMIIEVGKRRGVPVLDLYHNSGLRPWDDNVLSALYNENGIQDDGVHPNSEGHKFIHGLIREFIKNLM